MRKEFVVWRYFSLSILSFLMIPMLYASPTASDVSALQAPVSTSFLAAPTNLEDFSQWQAMQKNLSATQQAMQINVLSIQEKIQQLSQSLAIKSSGISNQNDQSIAIAMPRNISRQRIETPTVPVNLQTEDAAKNAAQKTQSTANNAPTGLSGNTNAESEQSNGKWQYGF